MEHTPSAPAAERSWRRENLTPGMILLLVTALAWGYTFRAGSMRAVPMPSMPGMEGAGTSHGPGSLTPFLVGWSIMMVAMMLPSALPLVLMYRGTAGVERTAARMGALLGGYVLVWTLAGLPVYLYNQLVATGAPMTAVLPGLLLVGGGAYQFSWLKKSCHRRCSSPLFYLAREWRPGLVGAIRLGVLHGVDCLGCCVGLMLGLVGLGMMSPVWMLTGAVVISAEKTLPEGHRVARPLGVALVAAGVLVVAESLLGR